MKRSFGVIDDGQHSPSVGRDDSSASPAWRPFCSCGWTGISIISSVQIEDLQEVFQKFATEHGIESVLPADAVFGDENSALIQVLQHVNYDPTEDERAVTYDLDLIVAALKNYDALTADTQELYDLVSELPRAGEAVADQKLRTSVWSTTSVPVLRENASENELVLRKYLIQIWETQQGSSTG